MIHLEEKSVSMIFCVQLFPTVLERVSDEHTLLSRVADCRALVSSNEPKKFAFVANDKMKKLRQELSW